MKLFDDTMNAVMKSMDLRFKRHVVLSSNVVNSETPGYRAREVDFAGELDKMLKGNRANDALKMTDNRHMDVGGIKSSHVIFDTSGAMKADGNTVDMDKSLAKASANIRAYTGAAKYLEMKLRTLRQAAMGRGGV